ncbi:sporulation protein YqfD [Clostridium chromiireducens]|uniref:Sporulation protein YqfD n=1 Tax=Clostridium chromiireducens TaxID=225345 RepID=A0A1V4IJ29_9CLOT|nr:sporulation protein YqfD [Clostridium chromiireducens]MVX63084.1 sporulation protein YqfD [Clostridium chromiireducens]OPJ60008.1 putative stage IV sporulation protein YqfD [Clostridium chromiireducens]RII34713.1 sporulation protein YqfD [Clostridium chromiireducens]
MFDSLKSGQITIEVNALMPEKILNILWNNEIYTCNIIRVNLTTLRFTIYYKDYKETEMLIKKHKGKVRIVRKKGLVVLLSKMKSRISLLVGVILFFVVIYGLSNYIWAIDIQTQRNLSPFEIRQQLTSIGIKPGIDKSQINVYDLEKKMENLNDQIMWIRIRVEGSTLKLVIKEKVNPPSTEKTLFNQVIAKMDGEVKRIYTNSGNPAVVPGDIVKKGDNLILPIQGREGFQIEVKPSGTVIANTFYEKFMEVQISGDKLERTGEKSSDIYLSFYGKKIYLKKAINEFTNYDKIEEDGGFFNKVTYFEKKGKPVNLDKDITVKESTQKLEDSLKKTLSNDAKIIDKKVTVDDIGNGKILVKAIFTVEQDIARNIS